MGTIEAIVLAMNKLNPNTECHVEIVHYSADGKWQMDVMVDEGSTLKSTGSSFEEAKLNLADQIYHKLWALSGDLDQILVVLKGSESNNGSSKESRSEVREHVQRCFK